MSISFLGVDGKIDSQKPWLVRLRHTADEGQNWIKHLASVI